MPLGAAPTDSDAKIMLGVLSAVEENCKVTQRSIAADLGIALGLTNAYLKRCIKKGFIKVSQAPANRYAYYLTPHGFSEKSRLTARYLSISFNFYRSARQQCEELFDTCDQNRWSRVLLCGKSDLVEIATLCLHERPLTIVGIWDPTVPDTSFLGFNILQTIAGAGTIDAAIICSLKNPQSVFDEVSKSIPSERILAPRFSNISRRTSRAAE